MKNTAPARMVVSRPRYDYRMNWRVVWRLLLVSALLLAPGGQGYFPAMADEARMTPLK